MQLLEKFVCVRLVQGFGLDLARFQFDRNLTWAVFFMNADGTIYGRYGSRTQQDAAHDVTLEGFRKAAEGALDLHARVAAERAALEAKKGPAPRWRVPEEIPALKGKHRKGDVSRQGCVHCHFIAEGEVRSLRAAKKPIPDALLWAYPPPGAVGLELDPKEAATVARVAPGSAAARAGFKTGDRIARLDGQPIISIADVQWVLHGAKEPAKVAVEVARSGGGGGGGAGATVALELDLAKGFRRATDFTWRTVAWTLRWDVGGFKSRPLPPDERKKRGIAADACALELEMPPDWLKSGNVPTARKLFQKGDVIVAVDGSKAALTEGELLAYLVQKKGPGERVVLTVLRSGKLERIELPLQ